jgi:hypothetical protein
MAVSRHLPEWLEALVLGCGVRFPLPGDTAPEAGAIEAILRGSLRRDNLFLGPVDPHPEPVACDLLVTQSGTPFLRCGRRTIDQTSGAVPQSHSQFPPIDLIEWAGQT